MIENDVAEWLYAKHHSATAFDAFIHANFYLGSIESDREEDGHEELDSETVARMAVKLFMDRKTYESQYKEA